MERSRSIEARLAGHEENVPGGGGDVKLHRNRRKIRSLHLSKLAEPQ